MSFIDLAKEIIDMVVVEAVIGILCSSVESIEWEYPKSEQILAAKKIRNGSFQNWYLYEECRTKGKEKILI